MPRNGSGTYSPPAGQPVVSGTTIDSAVFNTLVADLGTEFTRSVATDGQSPMAAALSLGGFKITNLAAGTLSTDAARVDQLGGPASTLRTDLALTSGASLSGFIQGLTGATATTVQDQLRKSVYVENFFIAAEVDAVAMFNRAAASGAKLIHANDAYVIGSASINIPSNVAWDLSGATFTTTTSAVTLFSAVSVSDFSINGPFKITGNGSTVGTAIGILVQDCARWRINDPTVVSLKGTGIKQLPGASATARSNHGVIANPRIDACYNGMVDEAGTGAEYSTVINAHVTGCANAGIWTAAGNIVWLGGQCVDNILDGVVLSAGSNHSHGMFVGMNINHNGRFNLYAAAVTNGEDFIGCHFYAYDAAGNGSIFFDLCKGIHITGGHLDCQIYNYAGGGSGENRISNMYCPGSYGVARRAGTNNGHYQLLISDCWGPGSYTVAGGGVDNTGVTINDPSACGVLAQRDPAATQALVSGASATLVWSQELFDRRNAFNIATGIFTVPAAPTQAGLYRVCFDLVFSGTAMVAADSYVTFNINAAVKKFFFTSPFGTTKLSAGGTFDVYLAAGDAIHLAASITGTNPVFGDASVLSNFSVKRLA